MRKEIVIISFVVLFIAALSFCIWDTVSAGENDSKSSGDTVSSGAFSVTAADQDTGAGEGALLLPDEYGKTEEIREPGTYILSGEYKDTIMIDAEDQNVRLILDNAVIGLPYTQDPRERYLLPPKRVRKITFQTALIIQIRKLMRRSLQIAILR